MAGPLRALNRVQSRLKHVLSLIIVILGITLSVLVFSYSLKLERQGMVEDLETDADNYYSALKRETDSSMQVLESLKALYMSSERVERSEFHIFSGHFFPSHRGIQALEWVPRVPDSLRKNYEVSARQGGFPHFRFSERLTQGDMVRAARRKEYFPVYFIEPYRGNEAAFGFDLASNPTRKESLERIVEPGKEDRPE